ncbi:MAG: alpha-L-fucosidase [Clostridiales bacterium]|nr:alpha-L-fucosidase [Clostridiales bacterium]
MKHFTKRLLAAVLSAALVLTGSSLPACAADSSETTMVTDDDLTYVVNLEEPSSWGATPNEEQLWYMKQGLAAFVHFGPNTFNNVEWGESYGTTDPSEIFTLSEDFDAYTMVKALQDAGFSRIIVTAKHHDGFCIWQSAYTDYDMGSVDYKDGEGDILAEISEACTYYNMDMGIYLSPWDIHEDYYGCFGDNNNTANYAGYTDYNELYIAWITEICTATDEEGNYLYGNNNPNRRSDRFVEWWLDGAQGSTNHTQTYDWTGILSAIRETNPNCQIFGTHAAGNGVNESDAALASTGGIHWIGNENGYASDETWAKVTAGENYESMRTYDSSLGQYVIKGESDGDTWSVPEADTTILSGGWFWSESKASTLRSLSALGDIYFNSVGHGATLLLNVSPDNTGSVPDEQLERIAEFAAAISETFDEDFTKADGVTASASSVWGNSTEYAASNVLDEIADGETYDETYWAPAEGESSGTLEIDFGKTRVFNVVSLEEYIQKGQCISSFKVEYKNVSGEWVTFASGSTVSSMRLCRGNTVAGSAIRITVEAVDEDATPMLVNVGVYKAADSFALDDGTVDYCIHENTELQNASDATCTTDGYTGDVVCTDCGETVEAGSVIPATGHSYEVTASQDATCTEDGSVTYTCSVCGDSYTETVAATGHSYEVTDSKAATCAEDGYVTYTCSVCGDSYTETVTATGHSWDAGTVTKEATTEEEGEITYTCTACGETKTEVIAKELKVPEVSVSVSINSNGKLSFTGTYEDYENSEDYYTVTSHGLVYMLSAKLNYKALTVNTSGRTRVNFSKYSDIGSFTYSITPASNGAKYTVRAFLAYTNAAGKTVYVYSDPIETSLNALK